MKTFQKPFWLSVVLLAAAIVTSGCANPRPTATQQPHATAPLKKLEASASSDSQADTLYFRIGGFLGPCHEVEFKQGKLRYRTGDGGRSLSRKNIPAPTTKDWEQFWAAIEQAGVWEWNPDYSTPKVVDGTQWSLTLQHAGRTVVSTGNNAYPGGTGPTYPPTSSFAHFLLALQNLTGVKGIQ